VTAGLVTAASASAETILYDDFSDDGGLNGSTTTTGDGTWVASSYRETSGGVFSVAANSTSYVTVELTEGYVYTLSVDMTSATITSTTSLFAGLGFFDSEDVTTDKAYTSGDADTPWMFVRTGNTTSTSIGDMSLRADNDTSLTIDSNLDVTETHTYSLVLDTTDDEYTLSLYVDDEQYGDTIVYSVTESAALLTSIDSVGLTTSTLGSAVIYDNFLLTATSAIPEPGSFALIAGFLGLTAVMIRRRK
jgi:hypothetical protein